MTELNYDAEVLAISDRAGELQTLLWIACLHPQTEEKDILELDRRQRNFFQRIVKEYDLHISNLKAFLEQKGENVQ